MFYLPLPIWVDLGFGCYLYRGIEAQWDTALESFGFRDSDYKSLPKLGHTDDLDQAKAIIDKHLDGFSRE